MLDFFCAQNSAFRNSVSLMTTNQLSMIKFFRRIRRQLLGEGKTGKYLKYAIGEIVLVVLGILIAVGINSWNNQRQLKIEESNFYNTIKNQIEDDKNDILDNKRYNERYLNRFTLAKQLIAENNALMQDTLVSIIPDLMYYSDFDKQGNIYETSVNSGKIELVSNSKIVELIQDLEDRYLYVNRMETIHFEVINNNVISKIIEIVNIDNQQATNPENLYTPPLQNLIIILMEIMKEKAQTYNDTIAAIDSLILEIDKELNTNND